MGDIESSVAELREAEVKMRSKEEEARQEAESLIATARRKAAKMREEAKAEAIAVREDALAKGRAAVEREVDGILNDGERAAREVRKEGKKFVRRAADEIISKFFGD